MGIHAGRLLGRLLFGDQSGSKSIPLGHHFGEPDIGRLDPPALE
jgi:hypothetical protein